MKSIFEKVKENKKIAIIAAIIVMVIIVILILLGGHKDNSVDSLKTTYSDGKTITYSKLTKKFKDTRKITIKNTSNKPIIYDLRWFNVQNTLTKQDDLLYEISCKGDGCQSITSSVLPTSDFPLFVNIKLDANKKHVYTISLRYKGSEKKAKFTGELKPLVINYDDAK